jgi:hypothetical protein
MDLLQNLLGGGQGRQEYQDFANRYDQGSPYEGISGQEAYDRYNQIAPQLPQDVYQNAARESFSRMAPQDRQQFGRMLQQSPQQQGYNFPDLNGDGIDDRTQDPNYLAQVTGQMHQQNPGLLGQLLGGGQQQVGGSGLGNMLSNPLAKAALGGIAAMAFRQMMSGGASSGGLGGALGNVLGGGNTTPRGGSGGGGFGGTQV